MRRLPLVIAFLAATIGHAAVADDGQYLYVLHCSGCHLRDGSGSVAGRIPALAGTVGHFQRLLEGRLYTIQVPGIMNSGLKDDDVAALVNWLVPHFAGSSLQGAFKSYTAAEIAAARRNRPTDIFAARRAVTAGLRRQGVEIPDY